MTHGLVFRLGTLAVAIGLLVVAWTNRTDARRHGRRRGRSARPGRAAPCASERAHLARTRSDLAAARAAVADFTTAAQLAVGCDRRRRRRRDRAHRPTGAAAVGRRGRRHRRLQPDRRRDRRPRRRSRRRHRRGIDAPFENYSRVARRAPHRPVRRAARRTTIEWVAYGSSGLQCARLAVPLDYARAPWPPDRAHRRPPARRRPERRHRTARHQPRRTGSVGDRRAPHRRASRCPTRSSAGSISSASIPAASGRARRSTAPTTWIRCSTTSSPTRAQARRTAALDRVERLVRQCGVRSGDLLRHLDTQATARDLDRVRDRDGRRPDLVPRLLLRHLPRERVRRAVPRPPPRRGARRWRRPRPRPRRRHARPRVRRRRRRAAATRSTTVRCAPTCPLNNARPGRTRPTTR